MRRSVFVSLLAVLLLMMVLLQLTSPVHGQQQHASAAEHASDDDISSSTPTTIDQDEYDTTRATLDSPHTPLPTVSQPQPRKPRKLSSDFEASPFAHPTPKDKQPRATSSPLPSTATTASAADTASDFASRLLSFGVLDAPSGGWWFEVLAVSLLTAYVVNLWYGRRVNDKLADTVFSSLVPLLSSQFALLGAYDPHAVPASQLRPLSSHADILLFKDSAHTYQLYCSGRRNCSGLLLTLECVKRQDLLSRVLSFFSLAQERDQLTVDCSLEAMQPFILAVVKRKFEARMKKNVNDLRVFTDIKRPQSIPLPQSLSLMTDSVEASEAVLSERVRATLAKHESSVILLHVSDQAIPSHLTSSKRIMHFKCYLPTQQALVELMTAMCGLVDAVTGVRLTGLALQKAVERRRLADELEAKKAKQDSKKDEAKVETAEEKAEKEEKKKKKDEKKMRPRIKMMK